MALVWDASRARRDTGSGTFVVHERIAAGGMAEVFLATRRGLEGFAKPVVLKRILPEYAEDEKFCEMFVREARLGAHLSHPNVVQVLDLGRDAGSLFIALEYVPGPDLARWLRMRRNRGRPYETRLACHVVHEIAAALEHAHGATGIDGEPLHIVHRDVSPHNVLVSIDGAVKLGDFGIARATSMSDGGQTQTGTVKGKLSYMSPEQARGEAVDARTDVFSASVILYELLTLQRPYGMSVDAQFILRLHAGNHTPATEHRPELPRRLASILERGLAPKPRDRFASAGEMRWELARFLSDGPPIGRAEVTAALAEDLPDDVHRARGLVHRALGRAQTSEHTETVEVEVEADRTVLETQLERAFRSGTLLGMAVPEAGKPPPPSGVVTTPQGLEPVTASGVQPTGSLPPSERPTVRSMRAIEDDEAPARRSPWVLWGVLALFAAATAGGIVIGGAGNDRADAPEPAPTSSPSASPSPTPTSTPTPTPTPSAAPTPSATPPPLPTGLAPEPAPVIPDLTAPDPVEPPRTPAPRGPRPPSSREPAASSTRPSAELPPAAAEGRGTARVTVRAPNGWAKVFLNGAGPFMAPFRDREVPAGRLSVRFESPRGDLSVQRQARPGESVLLSAP